MTAFRPKPNNTVKHKRMLKRLVGISGAGIKTIRETTMVQEAI